MNTKDWKDSQKATFTNWVNQKLKPHTELQITDIYKDLHDGLILIQLISILLKTTFKHHKSPKNNYEKMENISISLSAIKNNNVHLENISAVDVACGNENLILGLVWSIMLKFIEKDLGSENALEFLLKWINSRVSKYGIVVRSFKHNDWCDGLILNAILYSYKPEMDFNEVKNKTDSERIENAFLVAEQTFGIVPPACFGPTNENPYNKELFTYVSDLYLKIKKYNQEKDSEVFDQLMCERKENFLKKRAKLMSRFVLSENSYEYEFGRYKKLNEMHSKKTCEISELSKKLSRLIKDQFQLTNQIRMQYIKLNAIIGNINTLNNVEGHDIYMPHQTMNILKGSHIMPSTQNSETILELYLLLKKIHSGYTFDSIQSDNKNKPEISVCSKKNEIINVEKSDDLLIDTLKQNGNIGAQETYIKNILSSNKLNSKDIAILEEKLNFLTEVQLLIEIRNGILDDFKAAFETITVKDQNRAINILGKDNERVINGDAVKIICQCLGFNDDWVICGKFYNFDEYISDVRKIINSEYYIKPLNALSIENSEKNSDLYENGCKDQYLSQKQANNINEEMSVFKEYHFNESSLSKQRVLNLPGLETTNMKVGKNSKTFISNRHEIENVKKSGVYCFKCKRWRTFSE